MKTIATVVRTLLLACCAGLLAGCSEDQAKKQEQKGKEAAEAIKQPMDEAKKAAAEVSNKAEQTVKAAADDAKKAIEGANLVPGQAATKEKKKRLEGC